jgi:hypothetical protein
MRRNVVDVLARFFKRTLFGRFLIIESERRAKLYPMLMWVIQSAFCRPRTILKLQKPQVDVDIPVNYVNHVYAIVLADRA